MHKQIKYYNEDFHNDELLCNDKDTEKYPHFKKRKQNDKDIFPTPLK